MTAGERKRARKQVQRNNANLDFVTIRGRKRKVDLQYRYVFKMPPGYCGFCGLKHAQHQCDQVPPTFNVKGVVFCNLEFCTSRHLHLTRACPTLHSKCIGCGFRGHTENHCADLTAEEHLQEFEELADEGLFTGTRKEDGAWSFWNLRDERCYGAKTGPSTLKWLHLKMLPFEEGEKLARQVNGNVLREHEDEEEAWASREEERRARGTRRY